MKKILTIILTIIVCVIISDGVFADSFSHQRFKRRAGWNSLQKDVCKPNLLYGNATVRVIPISRSRRNITLTFTIFKPLNNLTINVKQWQKMNSNRYMPGFYDFTIDVCDMVNQLTNPTGIMKVIMENYNPIILEKYKPLIHPCPYVGEHKLIIDHSDSLITKYRTAVIPPADYRFDFTIYSKDIIIAVVESYESTK